MCNKMVSFTGIRYLLRYLLQVVHEATVIVRIAYSESINIKDTNAAAFPPIIKENTRFTNLGKQNTFRITEYTE